MTARRPIVFRRGWLLGSLVVLLVVPARGQPGAPPPSPSADPPVPAPRSLSAADARRVGDLNRTIDRHRRAGAFTEAVEPARQALAIVEKALGPDHWQPADARRAIATLELIAGLPEDGRKAVASVGVLEDRGSALSQKGRFAEAERVAREALTIREHWLGAG